MGFGAGFTQWIALLRQTSCVCFFSVFAATPVFSEKISVAPGDASYAILSEPTDELVTRALATCVGLAGYNRRTGEAFLTHFLFYSGNLERSVEEAREIWATLLEDLKSPLADFEIHLVGGSFGADHFGQEIYEHLLKSSHILPHQIGFRMGGDRLIREILISQEGIELKETPSGLDIE